LSFYIDSSRGIFYKYYNAAETRRGHLSFTSLIFLTASVARACMFCARSNGYPGKSYLAELRHWCSVDCDVVHCDGSAAVAVVSVPSKCCQRGRQRSGEHAKWSHHSAWTAYVSRFGWCLLLIHIAPLYSFSAPYSWCLLTMIVFFQTSFTTCLNSLLLDHCSVTVSLKVSPSSLPCHWRHFVKNWNHIYLSSYTMSSVLWHCWLGARKSTRPVNIEWCLSGARCRLFACGPADASASQNPVISCLI